MNGRLEGKVAIVTGAGSIAAGMGIGRATALLFSRHGARVLLVDLNPDSAAETENMIKAEDGRCSVFQADVSLAGDCRRLVEACILTYGRIDILDNNVALGGHGGPVETTEEDWDRLMNVNLKSMFLTSKYVLPHLEKQAGGVIINISSVNALRTAPYPTLAYSVSKAGVIALTREIAIQYAAKGIRANAILPGLMKTPRVAHYYRNAHDGDVEKMWQRRDAMSPTGRQGDAWDIASAALYLASDESKYVNGTTLLVDGGLTQTTKQW